MFLDKSFVSWQTSLGCPFRAVSLPFLSNNYKSKQYPEPEPLLLINWINLHFGKCTCKDNVIGKSHADDHTNCITVVWTVCCSETFYLLCRSKVSNETASLCMICSCHWISSPRHRSASLAFLKRLNLQSAGSSNPGCPLAEDCSIAVLIYVTTFANKSSLHSGWRGGEFRVDGYTEGQRLDQQDRRFQRQLQFSYHWFFAQAWSFCSREYWISGPCSRSTPSRMYLKRSAMNLKGWRKSSKVEVICSTYLLLSMRLYNSCMETEEEKRFVIYIILYRGVNV